MCPRALSFIWFRLLELLGTIVPFSGAPIPFTSLFLTLQNFRGLECLEKRSTGIGEVLKVHSLSRLYFICFRRAWTRNWFSHPMPLKGQALDGTTFSYPRSVGRLPFHCPHLLFLFRDLSFGIRKLHQIHFVFLLIVLGY